MMGASAATDWEFLSCPVIESVPGFNYKNISALGVAVLVNASEDIGTFLDFACNPYFSGTYLTYIVTKCVNPIFEKLGIPCTRQITIEGYTPLILAVLHGTAATVKKLAQIPQINLDAETSDYWSPLCAAVFSGNLEMVKILSEAGASLEIGGGEYLIKPLGLAVNGEHLDVVRYLISQGANVSSTDNRGITPAYFAAIFGYLDILESLEKAGADLDILYGEDQFSSLYLAILDGHTDVAIFLIKKGANVDTQSAKGFTPAYIAAQKGNLPVLKALAEAGASLEIKGGKYEMTPLAVAAVAGQLEIVQFLKEEGADLDAEDVDRKTPLDLAREFGNDDIVKILEEK